MRVDLKDYDWTEIDRMQNAVGRAQGGLRWWLKNNGHSHSKFGKDEIDQRRKDLRALADLWNVLASTTNRARIGGPDASSKGGR